MPHPFNPLPAARLAATWALLALVTSAHAQTPPPPASSPMADGKDQVRIERISHEDGLARVDELRVAGQTRSIDVTPKNGAPAYEIAPAAGGADLSAGSAPAGHTGKSRWRIFSF